MNLLSLILVFVCVLIVVQFWRLRGIAEYMVEYANQYCNKHNLQYISLARTGSKFTAYKGKLDWHLNYQMEFSSDGESGYVGTLTCHGKQVINIDLPAYRIAN